MSGIVGKNLGRSSGVVTATPVGADTVSGASIADDSIDSEHYIGASIDTAAIATNQIDETLIKDAFVADFTEVTIATGDSLLLGDVTDSGNTKRDTVQGLLDLVSAGGNTYMWNTTKNMADGTGTTIVLGSAGFTPKMVICFANENNTDRCAIGMQDNGAGIKHCLAQVGGSTYARVLYSFLAQIIPAAGKDAKFAVTTWGADGITLTYTKGGVPTGTARLLIVAVG